MMIGGRPDDGEIVRHRVRARAGLVANAPVPRHARPQLFAPVLFAVNHAVSFSREAADSAVPSTVSRRSPSIATGLVVSRGSPGVASFRSGSRRSRRVTL